MGDDHIGFIPAMPDGLYMPDGYEIEGISYRDDSGRMRAVYYWVKDGECGPNVSTILAARRGAMVDLNGLPDPRQNKLKLRGGKSA